MRGKKRVMKVDIKKLRDRAATALMFILECLGSKFIKNMINIMLAAAAPVVDEHRALMVYLRNKENVRKWYAAQACGFWKVYVCRIFAVLEALEPTARAMGRLQGTLAVGQAPRAGR